MSVEYEITIQEIVTWLDTIIEHDSRLLDNRPIITDTEKDITQNIEGRLQAYIEVRGYVRRGKMGQPK